MSTDGKSGYWSCQGKCLRYLIMFRFNISIDVHNVCLVIYSIYKAKKLNDKKLKCLNQTFLAVYHHQG